jgi:cytidyltransferase-like protein
MIFKSVKKIKNKVFELQDLGKTVLVKKGVYDIIHPGHIYSFRKLKEIADILIILPMNDKEVSLRKPGRPINSQKDRAVVLDSLDDIDYVFLENFTKDNVDSRTQFIDFLGLIKPDFVSVKAGDKNKRMAYEKGDWKMIYTEDKPAKEYSTINIINKIIKTYS